MNTSWLRLTILLALVTLAKARPKDDIVSPENKSNTSKEKSVPVVASTTQDSYLPITQDTPVGEKVPDIRQEQHKGIEFFANVARASNDDPSMSVAQVTDQLIKTIDHLVEKDMRTPPKLKEIVKEKAEKNETVVTTTEKEQVVDKVEANGKFQLKEPPLSADASEGKASSSKKEEVVKGVAVPVIMDEDMTTPPKKLQKIPNVAKPAKEEKKKVATTSKPAKEPPTTTPSSGLSTWILLSDNRDATTPSTPKNKKTTLNPVKKPGKNQATTVRPTTVKIITKKNNPKQEAKTPEPISALETMVKNNQKKNKPQKDNSDNKKVVTIPPAIAIETTELSTTDSPNPDSTVETTTKKKKTSTKKRKKNKNRRKKPAEKSGDDQEVKDIVKQPKQPVGAQFYNFLSREIMPTVGLGLVGVLVTAGLAGLLGYNPFVGANLPVRRTYESQHGYSPNNYYAYNSEYGDTDGGQNEEVLFREVLSGMPEDSRYNLPHSDVSYPESQLYNSQEQAYDSSKTPDKKGSVVDAYGSGYGTSYDAYSNKESVSKYPVYSNGGSYVYPEHQSSTTEKFKASAKYTTESTIEKQPEALYRVSSDYSSDDTAGSESETSWHRIGSPLDYGSSSHMELGPRRLDLDKLTSQVTGPLKRSKRSPEGLLARIVRKSNEITDDTQNDLENEIDFDGDIKEVTPTISTQEEVTTVDAPTEPASTEKGTVVTEDSKEPSLLESFPTESATTTQAPPSLIDVIRRLAHFKLRLGLSFLKTSAEAFSKYLDGVQQKVEETMANDSSFPSMREVWLARDSNLKGSDMRVREKRFQRDTDEKDYE